MTEQNLALLAGSPIIDKDGKVTLQFARKWQDLVKKLEDHEARIVALEP